MEMTKKGFFLSLVLAASGAAFAQPYAAYHDGLIRHIQPKGWINEFLNRQRTGMTGHPEAIAYPYNTCLWAGEIARQNECSFAKDWWRYEQSAYYTDGLLRLGYVLGDTAFINKGERGIRYTIDHAQPNGRLGNVKIESQWPMAVFFRAMKAAYEYRADAAIPQALERHYLSLSVDQLVKGRRHIVNLEGMLWTYGITHNAQLLAHAEQAYNRGGFELDARTAGSDKPIRMHGVTYCEMLKIPLLLYAYTGKQQYLDLALHAERKLERDHMLPDGVPTSAEFTSGNSIDIAHETCDIADYTWSLGYFLTVTGRAEWADRIERAVFNAGLGCVTKDFKSLQYFSSVNQLIATGTSDNNAFKRGKTWMQYRPIHETECCAGNVHRIMPNYVSRMWLTDSQGGVVAALFGPSCISTSINKVPVQITENTRYPFSTQIEFTIYTPKSVKFPFKIRIPGWAKSARLTVNGRSVPCTPATFATISRKFRDGDKVCLAMDAPVNVKTIAGQGMYVERGPLLYSYAIPQTVTEDTTTYANMSGKKSANPDFKCWSIRPAGAFNYAIDPTLLPASLQSVPTAGAAAEAYPFDLRNVPEHITLPVRRIVWTLQNGTLNPLLPAPGKVVATDTVETVTLVPYGCTELRLTVFPVVKSASCCQRTDTAPQQAAIRKE